MAEKWEEWRQYHSWISGMRQKWVNEEIKEITAKRDYFSEMTQKWVKNEGFSDVSQILRGWNRGFLLVESRKSRPLIGRNRMISKIQAIGLSSRNPFHSIHFGIISSHSWDEISFSCHQIHYGMTAVWLIQLHSKLIHTQPISFYIHSVSFNKREVSPGIVLCRGRELDWLLASSRMRIRHIPSYSTLIQSHEISEKSVQASSSAEDGSWLTSRFLQNENKTHSISFHLILHSFSLIQ